MAHLSTAGNIIALLKALWQTARKRQTVLMLGLAMAVPAAQAQEVAEVQGTYLYELDFNSPLSLREIKEKCFALAKADAIKKRFGELITSDVIDSYVDTNGESSSSFFWENTEAKAKGVWLGDTKEPKFDVNYHDGKLFIDVEVWGKAREIKQSNINLKWKILKDGNGKRIPTEYFDNRENVYVNFKTPADGYVAIYMIEGIDETTCLLPYPRNTAGYHKVKGGQEYVFFDKEEDQTALQYRLVTNGKPVEKNQLVIVYSPNPIYKCNEVEIRNKKQVLSTHKFQKWLLDCQRADEDMVVNKKWVTIRLENN